MDQAPKEKLERIDFVLQELNILSDSLRFAGDVSKRDVLLCVRARKRGSFIPIQEEINTDLKKKPAN